MKKIFTLVGMAAGVACIIFGIITFVLGGNAYTIDKAEYEKSKPKKVTGQTEEDYQKSLRSWEAPLKQENYQFALPFGIGGMLMFGGIGMSSYFAYKFFDNDGSKPASFSKPYGTTNSQPYNPPYPNQQPPVNGNF